MKTDFGDPRLPARFWAKARIDAETGCWVWTAASHHTGGYGMFSVDRRMRYAHRVAYAALVGELPDRATAGLELDHLCRNRTCCNPSHLELVSTRVNLSRADGPAAASIRNRMATGECLRGHNDWIRRADGGGFCCRSCRVERSANLNAAIKSAAIALEVTQEQYIRLHGSSLDKAVKFIEATS